MKTAVAWMLWLITCMVFILSTRNPIYIMVVLLNLLILGNHLAKKKRNNEWLKHNTFFLLTMIGLSTIINSLFAHSGRNILFTLPKGWPLIGGNITLESLVYGAINGLVISALYLLFNILNLSLQIKQLTRLIPRAFHPIAMMVTIALTFFPSIQQRAQEIKEAQIIRGNPMKKMQDWIPILIPLLVTSLENAIQLSESMTARGYHVQVNKNTNLSLVGLVFGAFSIFSAWILQLYNYPEGILFVLYILGGLIILLTLLHSGKQRTSTQYYKEQWGFSDLTGAVFMSVYLLAYISLLSYNKLPSLFYSPYPNLSFPPLQLLGLLFSVLSIFPLFLSFND